ncbi:MAG: hypothetical protein RI907_3889 [Pseudomonadota bacterium]|jgi:S1-C subfamily serine protease
MQWNKSKWVGRAVWAALCASLIGAGGQAWADDAETTGTIQFTAFKITIAPGDKIGHMAGGMFCFDNGNYTYMPERHKAIFQAEVFQAFKREMAAARLPIFQGSDSAFDTGASNDPDFRLGGTLSEANFDMCTRPGARKGTLHVGMKWELFSVRQQKVVFSKVIPGDYTTENFDDVPAAEFESRGFGASLRTLFADATFQSVIRNVKSGGDAAAASAPVAEAIRLKPGPASAAGGAQKNAADLRGAVVSIDNGSGTGTGFYVSDGYILSNRHVVGSSKYVKVKLASGKEVVGEVLRQDGPRDVALVKTEAVAGVAPLRVRTASPAVGDDVFAVGSPLGQELAGTFTKGVLSGQREKAGLKFLQSDVAVNPGNSGGPLLDNSGAVIGITVAKVAGAEGLAFFIPIQEALSKLAIEFEPASVAAVAAAPAATAASAVAGEPTAAGSHKKKKKKAQD